MNDAFRRRTDKLGREKVFTNDNEADFPADSPVAVISAQINEKLEQIYKLDAQLTETLGDKIQALAIKTNSRDIHLDKIRDIAMAAIAVSDDEVQGITSKFKVPRDRTDQNLVAAGTAFYNDTAPPLDDILVKKGGLTDGFRETLQTSGANFQQAWNDVRSAVEEHGEAIGALEALIREVMNLSRRRSALIKLKYKNNPGKLAAWAIASHLERPPRPAPTPQNS